MIADRPGAGEHAAAERPELFERQRRVDDDGVAHRGDRMGGERRLAEPARGHVGPAGDDPGRAVEAAAEQVADEERVAVAGEPVAAVAALAARVERQHDVVADGDGVDARTDGLDDAGALVPGDDRRRRHRPRGPRQDVGVAHAGGDDADEQLACSWVGQLGRLQCVLPVGAAQDGGGDLHGSLRWSRMPIARVFGRVA
jgi:hypothetical protein